MLVRKEHFSRAVTLAMAVFMLPALAQPMTIMSNAAFAPDRSLVTALAVRQTARLTFVPAPIGQTRAGAVNLTPGQALFRPIKAGRPVVLQRYVAGSWRTVVKSRENRQGIFTFNVPAKSRAGTYYKYRAVAPRWNGLASVNSTVQRAISWERPFEDAFTKPGLNPANWSYRALGERNESGDRLCSESSPNSVRVPGDGFAYLEVKQIPLAARKYDPVTCPHGEYYNGHIGTQDKFSFEYGVMAMRVKFQRQRGQHGGLWSQPEVGDGAEIDAVEYFGDGFRKDGIEGGIGHYVYQDGVKSGGIVDSRNLLAKDKTWSNSFHVFSVQWMPSGYIFRIDGNVVWRHPRQISNVPQYVILSLLTSDWELPQLDPSKLNPMMVDWVRVWERP